MSAGGDPGRTEVCIIGAGAAGGIIALELASRGIGSVILEAGPRHDFARRFEYMRRFLKGENPWKTPLAALDRYTSGGSMPYRLEGNRARGVGGSTLYWEGYALRFRAEDFRLGSLHGVAEDWPISYEELEPYYARAERALGVAGTIDDPWASPRSGGFPLPPFPSSYSDGLFVSACRRLGIVLHSLPQARNSIPYGGRARCRAYSTCHVCPIGAKASADLSHVLRAEATGHARVLTDVSALRLESGPADRVRAVVYAGHDRTERRLTARLFVVAAGAVESARLLLLSASRDAPLGLANRSGLVGRRFMSHPTLDVTGRVAQPVYPYRIGFSTSMTGQFAVGGDRRRRGAFFLEFLNSAGGSPAGLALASRKWGAALEKHVRGEFGRTLGVRIFCEQLPDPGNSVSLDPAVRDHFGSPAPRIAWTVGEYERQALEEAKGTAERILRAAGARDIRATRLRHAAHQIGTHRMGADPGTSVVDRNLRAHEVPNLYLVGSGSFVTASASPPTLTIAALSLRAADHIAGVLRG